MMYRETLPEGYVLKNWDYSYAIEDVRGQGGFGITYGARCVETGQHVAIKEYYPKQLGMQRADDGSVTSTHSNPKLYEGGMQSFLDEARALSKLRSIPSVVKALSFFQANKTAYLVMEFIEGISLKNLLLSEGTVRAYEFLPKFKVLIEDIDKMHKTGLLHRDIAPDNIMLTEDGSLKLIDFGSARSIENGKSMTVVLKPGFAPIEQYQSHGQGTYTDVYGICATLYYCLTGRVPPSAMDRLDDDPIVPANQVGAGLSQRQEAVLMRGLALQPPTAMTPGRMPRYTTVGEFIKEFPWDETPKPFDWEQTQGKDTSGTIIITHDDKTKPVFTPLSIVLLVISIVVIVLGIVLIAIGGRSVTFGNILMRYGIGDAIAITLVGVAIFAAALALILSNAKKK